MATDSQTATQKMSEEDINKLNTTLKSQPWYQDFFKQRGLNMNALKLSGGQRQALTALAAQHGYALGDRMKFDEAGNINQKGGFAGMPTWAKVAIAAAPIAGAAIATGGGSLPSLSGLFGGGAGGSSAAATTAALGGEAAAAPSIMSSIAGMAPIAGRMISAAGSAAANNRGATLDANLEHDRLGLLASQQTRDAESDAYRKSIYGQIASGYQPAQRPDGIPSRNPNEGFVTPQTRDAGSLMTDIAMQRLKSGNYGTNITPFSELPTKPGLMERLANYAGPALSLFDPRLYDQNGQPHGK